MRKLIHSKNAVIKDATQVKTSQRAASKASRPKIQPMMEDDKRRKRPGEGGVTTQ